jgi:hypothetical protein
MLHLFVHSVFSIFRIHAFRRFLGSSGNKLHSLGLLSKSNCDAGISVTQEVHYIMTRLKYYCKIFCLQIVLF